MMMKNYHSITIIHEDDSLPLQEGSTSLLLTPLPHHHHNSNSNDDEAKYYNPHPQDHLAPPFSASQNDDTATDISNTNSSSNRPSTLLVGTFNLIATIIGGGVLSLPIAFQKCGIFTTTLFTLLSAYMTYSSLIMLCYSSRRSGGSSYGEVVRSAFGERMEECVSWLLFIFLVFVIAAYMVLIRDIWTPLVQLLLVNRRGDDDFEVNGDRMLLGIIVVLLPFLFQRSLHALRWNCYIGFGSILVLCVALCRGGFQRYYQHYEEINNDDGEGGDDEHDYEAAAPFDIEFFKVPTTQDILFSFPIVMLAFLCHFNILSIQNTLNRPTRQRMKLVVGMAIGASSTLMYLFGLGGYLLYGSSIQGNVLLNIPIVKSSDEDVEEYWLFLLGRIGCGTTLILGMPLLALPCRDALLEVVDVLFHRSHHRSSEDYDSSSSNANNNDSLFWKLLHKLNKNETIQDATITTEDEVEIVFPDEGGATPEQKSPLLSAMSPGRNSILIRQDPIQRDWVFRNSMMHYGSTLLIVMCCYIGATKVKGVAEIWSLIGSSLAFLIAFILPFGCFIVIEDGVEGKDRHDGWIKAATVMLVLSIVGAVVCTWNKICG